MMGEQGGNQSDCSIRSILKNTFLLIICCAGLITILT